LTSPCPLRAPRETKPLTLDHAILQLFNSCNYENELYNERVSKKEKLIQKLLLARTFKFTELVSLLKMLGYTEVQCGGSRVKFDNGKPDDLINLHKPHPGNEMKSYVVKQVKEKLQRGGLI